MPEFKFEDTYLYQAGLKYKEWGEMLMNPETSIQDLVTFGMKYDVDVQLRVIGLAESEAEVEQEPTDE